MTSALCQELMQRGHRCIFLATRAGIPYTQNGLHQYFCPSNRPASRENQQFLKRFIESEKVDVIINQSGINRPQLELALSAKDQCPVLSVHHNCLAGLMENHESIVRHTLGQRGVPRWLQPKLLFRTLRLRSQHRTARMLERAALYGDTLVLLSGHFIMELQDFSNRISPGRVMVIPNPAPFKPDSSALNEKQNEILYVGRLANGQKRLDRLLAVWKAVSPELPGWRLSIVGDGPDKERIQDMASDLGFNNVYFHGKQDPVPYYRKARILLLTSDFEGFGMVLVEAQALGCVPVATRCFSAIDDVVHHGKNGLLAGKNDIDEFAAQIISLARDPVRWQQMAESGMEHIATFSPSLICDQWLQLIESSAHTRSEHLVGEKALSGQ